jgi:hypothetical protein
MPKSKKPVRDSASAKEASSSTDKPTRLLTINGGLVPEGSLMPLTGRNFHILKQLKINLLDVEAALPEEALIASKSQQIRRRSWRAFVKGAESISHVRQPIYLFTSNLLVKSIHIVIVLFFPASLHAPFLFPKKLISAVIETNLST